MLLIVGVLRMSGSVYVQGKFMQRFQADSDARLYLSVEPSRSSTLDELDKRLLLELAPIDELKNESLCLEPEL